MVKDLWINLPVKNVARSKEFFSKLGFKFSDRFGMGDTCAALLVGEKNVVVMLFEETAFKGMIRKELADADKTTELLISIDAESRQEVDEMAKLVEEAGGKTLHQPSEIQGWMYGCLFTDPDGHSWNMLYMDKSKMS